MAKKAQKIKKGKTSELLIVNPDAAGIDIASNEYQVCVPEDRDADNNRRFDAYTCDLHAIALWLQLCRIKTVAMEATGIYWVQLYIVLEEYGFDVVVCNAKHIKNLGEKKTDYVDACWIQLLHTYGLLTESFQPENRIREIKDMNRHRDRLIGNSNQAINRMIKALDMMNIKLHKTISDIKGNTGFAILKAIVEGERNPEKLLKHVNKRIRASREELLKSLEGNWSESQIFILKQNMDAYIFYQNQIKELDQKIEQLLKSYIISLKNDSDFIDKTLIRSKKRKNANNAPQFDMEYYAFRILGVNITMIPGVSNLTTLKLVAELGACFTDKFPESNKFCSWSNVTPNNKQSGGKLLSSKVPKRTNYVGQVLRVAAGTLKNEKGYFGDYFRAKKSRSSHNEAIIAVAHKMARILYKMVKEKVEYDKNIESETNKFSLQKKAEYYKKKYEKIQKELLLNAS